MAGSASSYFLAMVGAYNMNALYDTSNNTFMLLKGKGSLMELHQLPSFHLERWFAEFEFVPGMRNLAASGPFAVTTRELLELEGAETTARYLELDLDYIENPGSESLRQAVANSASLAPDVIRRSPASSVVY